MKYHWRKFMVWIGWRCPCHYLPTEYRYGWDYKEDGYYCTVSDRQLT